MRLFKIKRYRVRVAEVFVVLGNDLRRTLKRLGLPKLIGSLRAFAKRWLTILCRLVLFMGCQCNTEASIPKYAILPPSLGSGGNSRDVSPIEPICFLISVSFVVLIVTRKGFPTVIPGNCFCFAVWWLIMERSPHNQTGEKRTFAYD